MSDIIIVMKSGTIQQIGTPQDIYNEPANAFVADFIGESNIFDAKMEKDEAVLLCGAEFPCVDPMPASLVDVVIRPEDVEIVSPEEGTVVGLVEASLFKGVHYEMTVSCGSEQWIIHSTRSATPGERIGMRVAPENIHIMRRMFPDEENVIRAEVISCENKTAQVSFDGATLSLATEQELVPGDTVTLTVAPRDVELCDAEEGVFTGILDSVVWKGSHYEMILVSQHRRWLIKSQMDEQTGSEVSFRFRSDSVKIAGEVEG